MGLMMPQGGIISPILANIYLDKVDKYMEEYAQSFNKGASRRLDKDYRRIKDRKNKLEKETEIRNRYKGTERPY